VSGPPPIEDPLAPVPDDETEEEVSDPGDPGDQGGIDTARFRRVLGHFATGVTVVTTADEGEPAGLSVNSFTSVSLEPPLVAFCVASVSRTWPRIRAMGSFCVNILGEDQEDLSRAFARRSTDKFRGVGWRPAESGAPILAGVLAWLDCSVEAEHGAGDHVIVVGRVREMGVAHEGGPLVFYRGGYGRFQP
jgi:3-hydroxy-9,10-secoandrosta-1,3,5(10)-triene-9,17-dione monooxygenase reductase component